MPKKTFNIMRVSGWLPVSHSVYMAFETKIGENCYDMAKVTADRLNDNPKLTNKQLMKRFVDNLWLDDIKLIKNELQYESDINALIDFIRDSFIIYKETQDETSKMIQYSGK